jgi:DNA-binding transcriptional regulator YiaG
MTATEYKAIRESIGTPTEVARLLGVSRMTIHNRESGKPITEEAALAIVALAKRPTRR